MKGRIVVSALAAGALLVLLNAVSANAQLTDTGTIAGTITDQTGAAVPEAQITVINLGTNVRQSAATDADGQYVVPSLKVGTYSLTVEKAGFQTYVQTGILIDVQARVAVDVKLQVGATTQQIQVTAAGTLLHTQSAEIGQVIGSQQIVDLPLNTRQYDSLVFLSPGVTLASNNLRTNAGEGYFDANGNNGIQNNYVLDGVDNNSIVENFQGKSAQAGQPIVDAVSEFKLQTRTYDTEFGRSAGAVVNVQIKSGTNQIHGAGWEFIRNDHLDANDFFLNRAGAPKPIFQQNQFGGTLGGPIKKDKAFIFGAIERTPLRIGVAELGTVPTAKMQNLDFSELPSSPENLGGTLTAAYPQFANCFTGAVITNPSCVDPVGLKLMQLYPLPNTNTNGFHANNFVASPKETQNVTNYNIRADQALTSKDTLFEHWTAYKLYEHYPYIFQQTANPIADGATDISIWDVLNQNAAVGWTHVFNATTVLDVRGGYNRMRENAYPFNFGKLVNDQFGINGIPVLPGISGGLPEIDVAGFANLGASRWTPMVQKSYVWQYRAILSKIKGAHTIKAGAEWRRDVQDYVDDCCFRGQFGFNGQYAATTGFGITDMVLGLPQQDSLSNFEAVYAYYNGLNLFGQDTWRVSPKLTVNYGLRYELVTPLMTRNNHVGNFNPNANGGFGAGGEFFVVPLDASDPATRASVEYYKKAFAPRLGLAYRITDKFVFRGGFGIFYQNYDRRGSLSDLNENPPYLVSYAPSFNYQRADDAHGTPPSFLLQQGFPANTLNPPDIKDPAQIAASQLFGQDFHTRPGMIEQASGGFEYSFSPNLLFSASFVGNYGHRLWRYKNLNQKVLNTPGEPSGDVPFPDFVINPGVPLTQATASGIQWLESSGDTSWNALLVTLQKRTSKGLTFLVAYTASKGFSNYAQNIDSGYRAQAPPNAWSGSSKGLMAMDTPQRLVTSFTYALPFGVGTSHLNRGAAAKLLGNWQVNGILTFASGQPLSINAPFDTSQTGSGASLANCSGPTGGGPHTVNDWFNLTPYSVPQLYFFGNCGITPGPRTPGINNFDASLYKDFRITERVRVQFRAEAYDFFNHPQFGAPNNGCSASPGQSCAGIAGSSFGQISSLNVNTPPRQLQFGLKVLF